MFVSGWLVLVWLLEVCRLEENLHCLYVAELLRRPSTLRQRNKIDDICDSKTSDVAKQMIVVISCSYASALKVSPDILSSLKPSGHSLMSLIPSVLRAEGQMRSCKLNQRGCRHVKPLSHMNKSIFTLLVLGKSDVVLTGGVQNPKDGVEVLAGEQIWCCGAALLGNLQPFQLFHEKFSWILFNTQTQLYSITTNLINDVDDRMWQYVLCNIRHMKLFSVRILKKRLMLVLFDP